MPATEIRDLPTGRNLRSLLTLTPGLTATGLGADCVGGVGVWCNNNIYNLSSHTAANDTVGDTQGRVMVDGTIINTGGGAGIMGMTGGYVADIANAQEVNVQISGALGESETGGATINIIPRTGGNKFSGNYFNQLHAGGRGSTPNNEAYPSINSNYPLISDLDVTGAFGGPIQRDRLWFFSAGRSWEKDGVQQPEREHLGQQERRHLGHELPAGSVAAAAQSHQLDAQHQRAHHAIRRHQRTSSTSSGTRG